MSDVVTSSPYQSTSIRLFQSSAEVLAAHRKLDPTAPMLKDAYDPSIPLAPYTFPADDRVACQLVTKDGGGMCNQVHGRGCVISQRDGVQGFIGRDCGLEHFGADHAFARAAATADRQLELQQATDRLHAMLADVQLRSRLRDAFKRQQALAHRVRSVRKELPMTVLARTHEMAKANRNNLVVEVERRELIENKEGNEVEVSKWEPTIVGALRGLSALDILGFQALAERFRSATVTFNEADVTTKQLKNQLVAWARTLDDRDPATRDLQAAEDALVVFLRFENLKLLCWLCHEQRDRLQVARYALSGRRNAEISEQAARRPLEDWEGERTARTPRE